MEVTGRDSSAGIKVSVAFVETEFRAIQWANLEERVWEQRLPVLQHTWNGQIKFSLRTAIHALCIMNRGRRERETRRRHLVITKGERWKDGQRRCPKGLCTHSAWLPNCHHGNSVCVCVRISCVYTGDPQ